MSTTTAGASATDSQARESQPNADPILARHLEHATQVAARAERAHVRHRGDLAGLGGAAVAPACEEELQREEARVRRQPEGAVIGSDHGRSPIPGGLLRASGRAVGTTVSRKRDGKVHAGAELEPAKGNSGVKR